MAQDPKVDLVLDGVNSQESDTFGSLDQLPEATGLGSQMTDAASQEVPFEVDSGSQSQSQSQMSTDASEPAAEAEALQGNFPAVNIAPANKASPPGKKPSTKDGEAALAFLKAAAARGKNPPPKDKDSKGAAPNKAAGNGKGAPPMEAEVDAADVLLSLSMSAARRSGKNPAEVLPAAAAAAAGAAVAQLPQRKRSKADGTETPAEAAAPAPALGTAAAPAPKAQPATRTKKAPNPSTAAAAGKSPKTKDSSKDAKRADEVMKDAQDPPPPDSHPPPLDAVSATPPPTAAGEPALVTAVPLPEGIGGIKADSRPLSSGEKRSISMAVKAEFVNPEEVGYVHKFRWEEQPEPAKKKPKASSWVLPTKKTEAREKLQTGGVKAGATPARPRKSNPGSFSNALGAGGAVQKTYGKSSSLQVPVVDESTDPDIEREEATLKKIYQDELGHDVQFSHLQIQTSNIKVSFAFEDSAAVTIDQLTQHLKKDEILVTENYKVRVKEKSAASNNEGRTFFGGVLTITMDVWDTTLGDNDGHNTSVRLFGFRETDGEKRHKAQFNGCSCKHGDTLPFFREVFGTHYKMTDIRVEPNSVFSATDNAVMDPRFGLDMDQLKVCLDRCQEEDIVQNYNLQVTGGVNFSFTALKGTANQRTCKPTVQKSGSIQLMLVDAPRRIRLETMRFLIEHCKTAFAPLARLNLTKRTIDKRQKARRMVEQNKQREVTVSDKRTRHSSDKGTASQASRLKESSSNGAAASPARSAQDSAMALGMSSALAGLTDFQQGLASSAPPPPPPPDAEAVSAALAAAVPPHMNMVPSPAQIQEGFKIMAAAAAAQPGGMPAGMPDPFTLALMPQLLASGGADPFLNLPGAPGVASPFHQQATEEKKAEEEAAPTSSTAAAAAMAASDKELESLLP